jgi:hypothetical protein
MPFLAPTNAASGFLESAITAGQTLFTLRSDHGSRFPTMAAGEFWWGVLIDEGQTIYDRFEFFLCTARNGDEVGPVVRGQLGTVAKAFPIDPVGNPNLVRVALSENIANLMAMVDGFGAVQSSTATTLTAFSPRNVVLTPTAGDITQPLPTTDVWLGKRVRFVNAGTNSVAVTASGGAAVLTLPPGHSAELVALQDAPTTAAHWGVPATYFADGQYLFAAGTGGASHRGAGVLLDANGDPLTQLTPVTLAGSGGPTSGVLQTLSIPANTLTRDASALLFRSAGSKTGANGVLSLQPRWGAGGALTTHTISAACIAWVLHTLIIRDGVGSQVWVSWIAPNRDDTGSTTLVGTGTATEDETAALDFDVNCSAKHTDDSVSQLALQPIVFG